jgi:hypothetical protein
MAALDVINKKWQRMSGHVQGKGQKMHGTQHAINCKSGWNHIKLI